MSIRETFQVEMSELFDFWEGYNFFRKWGFDEKEALAENMKKFVNNEVVINYLVAFALETITHEMVMERLEKNVK